MLIDIHVRTGFLRDESIDPLEFAKRAEALGIEGLCFCERNTLESYELLREMQPKTKVRLFTACEVESQRGRLCFFPNPEEIPPIAIWLLGEDGQPAPAAEIVEKVRSKGGVVFAAQPYKRVENSSVLGDSVFDLKGLRGVEVFENGVGSHMADLAMEASEQLGGASIAGSGPLAGPEQMGRYATMFIDTVSSEEDLVKALLAGDVWPVELGVVGGGRGGGRHRGGRSGGNGGRRGGG